MVLQLCWQDLIAASDVRSHLHRDNEQELTVCEIKALLLLNSELSLQSTLITRSKLKLSLKKMSDRQKKTSSLTTEHLIWRSLSSLAA